jgi:adenylate cyclase
MAAALSKFQRRTRRTLRITLTWVIVGLVIALWESNSLEAFGHDAMRLRSFDTHFWRFLTVGLVGAGTYIFLLRDRLRKLPYLPALGIAAALIFLALLGWAAVRSTGAYDPFGSAFAQNVFSWWFLGQFLQWTLLMAATMLLVRLNDQFGSGAQSFLLGRYFKPKQELRIFMFLDMRSSTAIAEEIGDTRYFQLLNEVYADITDPVIYSEGDIYQYVGDEISVSWQLHRGVKGQRCLKCFFAIREKLQRRAEHYRKRYGIAPVFKAGFHYGQVTTGEIGLVKKQTIFSGDAVNTAAHIQAACNEHHVDNLMSKDLLDVLLLPRDKWNVRSMGEVPLKGKRRTVALYTIEPLAV